MIEANFKIKIHEYFKYFFYIISIKSLFLIETSLIALSEIFKFHLS
jgi:hypothetical protein